MKSHRINIPLLLAVIAVFLSTAVLGLTRLKISTDVSKSLPRHDKVIADALEIFANHPIHDQVAIDVAIDRSSPDVLVACSKLLQEKMAKSGLFAEIGMGNTAGMIPEVARQVAHHLPYLFSHQELEQSVAPRLTSEAIRERLADTVAKMASLEGIGQTSYIGIDPLGLKNLVLARLIHLAPSHKAKIYKENLISKDGKHLLLTARPVKAGSNTAAARRIAELFTAAGHDLNKKFAPAGIHVVLTPTGTYRAALDNEKIIRHDVSLALGLSTAGIILLLLLSFPRPLFSLLSLIPPLVGISSALFVYSLFHSSISIMVLGFSGALISVMDDYSITYLLFFDRPQAAKGKQAAREVQSIGGIIALLTTIASFLVLGLSNFPVFASLGEFTALGLAFTYLFIYFVCPKLFPVMPPSGKKNPPLHRISSWLFSAGRPGLVAAVVFACIMAFFAKPHFHLSLSAMNTVSNKTQEDSALFAKVWGDIGRKVYLMTTAASRNGLQEKNDGLLQEMEKDKEAGRIQSAFNPSMIFPGRQLGERNRAAWNTFWTPGRVQKVRQNLDRAGAELGFTKDAFAPFFTLLDPKTTLEPDRLSPVYDNLLGIVAKKGGKLVQFTAVTPGKMYNSSRFLKEYGRNGKIFDATAFSSRLSHILFTTFASSLLIMSVIISLMLFLYFLDVRLTVMTLLPLVFAYICTLGTLNLIGHPLDIPGLMLTVVILGLGVDYTIYTVCGRRRYGAATHTSYVLVKSAVLLSAASTLIGFGVLCFAEHATLKSIGITSLCGIGYSFLGTILILPPLLEAYLKRQNREGVASGSLHERILGRYRLLEAYPRIFARFKLKSDPLFCELPDLLGETGHITRVLDIGCGYGVPACWCLEQFPGAHVVGIDPDPERVRVAGLVVSTRGTIIEGAAPDLPEEQEKFDLVLLLDMLHYLDDNQLQQTLTRARSLLQPGGQLAARFVVQPLKKRSWYWYVEDLRTRLTGIKASYHETQDLSNLMSTTGFFKVSISASANSELFWIVGRAT
jgi:predicted exporter/trans-aconitate methyltransferase